MKEVTPDSTGSSYVLSQNFMKPTAHYHVHRAATRRYSEPHPHNLFLSSILISSSHLHPGFRSGFPNKILSELLIYQRTNHEETRTMTCSARHFEAARDGCDSFGTQGAPPSGRLCLSKVVLLSPEQHVCSLVSRQVQLSDRWQHAACSDKNWSVYWWVWVFNRTLRKLHDHKLHNMHPSANNIRMIKSRGWNERDIEHAWERSEMYHKFQ
jgi:hypothetical protein